MFGPAGMAYVYLIYGMYHCFNIVTDQDGQPSAVLLRAVELSCLPSWVERPRLPSAKTSPATPSAPKSSRKAAQKWRDRLGAGPGKLCRALDITLAHTTQPLQPSSGLWLEHRSPAFHADLVANHLTVTQTTRIGLSQGTDIPWRWYLDNSPAVSKR
jgi:DNA-3-methyladenine glycosylase